MINFPTMLTLARIVMIPLLVVVFYLPTQWGGALAAGLFLLAALTDALDGYLARHMLQTTRFGAFLDPVADKLMITTALALVIEHAASWSVTVSALIIIAREITVSALREWMSEVGNASIVAVGFWGKLKTVAQVVAIAVLLLERSVPALPVLEVGLVLLYLAVILTVWSMSVYLLAAYRHFRSQ